MFAMDLFDDAIRAEAHGSATGLGWTYLDVELQSLERLDGDAVLLTRSAKAAAEFATEDAGQGRLLRAGLCRHPTRSISNGS